jgi:hypothetical protein
MSDINRIRGDRKDCPIRYPIHSWQKLAAVSFLVPLNADAIILDQLDPGIEQGFLDPVAG